MSPKRFDRPSLAGRLCLLGLAGLAFFVASEAGPSEAATGRDAGHPGAIAQDDAKPAAAAKDRYETDSYVVTVSKVGDSYTAGKEGQFEIDIVPKEKFHINAQFPYKFKTVDPPPERISYPKPLLQRADGDFSEKRGVFKVPFVVKTAGKAKVGGRLSFSVCGETNCVMDKVELALDVDVR